MYWEWVNTWWEKSHLSFIPHPSKGRNEDTSAGLFFLYSGSAKGALKFKAIDAMS